MAGMVISRSTTSGCCSFTLLMASAPIQLADAATHVLTVVHEEHAKCAFRHDISQGGPAFTPVDESTDGMSETYTPDFREKT